MQTPRILKQAFIDGMDQAKQASWKIPAMGALGGAAVGTGVSALDHWKNKKKTPEGGEQKKTPWLRNILGGAAVGGAAGFGLQQAGSHVMNRLAQNPKFQKFIETEGPELQALENEARAAGLTKREIDEVLSSSLALVEAQNTYHTHVKLHEAFAESIKELKFHKDQGGGTVMVSDTWNASDAVDNPVPIHGYKYKNIPYQADGNHNPGFAIAAYPNRPELPLYLSLVPNKDGGIVGMSSRPTWQIKDPSATNLLSKSQITDADIAKWAPNVNTNTSVLRNFRTPRPPNPVQE